MARKRLENVDHKEDEHREENARVLARKLMKAVQGYEGATVIIAIGMVLDHIGRTA
jgi:hypothetical protein